MMIGSDVPKKHPFFVMSEVMIPESKLDPVESLTECLGEAVKLGGTHGTSMNIL